jgi:hypothetical protein
LPEPEDVKDDSVAIPDYYAAATGAGGKGYWHRGVLDVYDSGIEMEKEREGRSVESEVMWKPNRGVGGGITCLVSGALPRRCIQHLKTFTSSRSTKPFNILISFKFSL